MRIIWFRRDLRLRDNEILAKACEDNQEVLPIFIIDPWFYQQPHVSKLRIKFLFESLRNLDSNLRKLGSKLYLFEGNSVSVIRQLVQSLKEKGHQPSLYLNRDVQVGYGSKRDGEIIDLFEHQGLDVCVGTNHFLQDTPDYRTWWHDYHGYQQQTLYPMPERVNTQKKLKLDIPQLTFKALWEKYCPERKSLSNKFPGGENKAMAALDRFFDERYRGYHWRMSRPWLAQRGATSQLSVHLTFGTISARYVYQRARELEQQQKYHPRNQFAIQTFLDRLRWHDKFSQRHFFNPDMAWTNRYPEFDEYYDSKSLTGQKLKYFQAWCEGKTGFPMIDASMRQLNTIGWMNFRMRAMCVTFLCINCGVPWQFGADYFMSKLIDGDIAINHWQWQAQAGVTNPMSKTFRIYNPTKNLKEKDPYLQFVRHWIPELKGYTIEQLLEEDYPDSYPQPMLNFLETRKTNGKIVSDLRAKVRERLEAEGGEAYLQAVGAANTIQNYNRIKDREYRDKIRN